MPEKAPLSLLEIERLGGVFNEILDIIGLFTLKTADF